MSIPPKLPLRAPAIASQVRAAEQTVADLKAALRELAWAKVALEPGAHKAYADCEKSLAIASADLDLKIAALEAAAEHDRSAAASRIELIKNAPIEAILEGMTATECCAGCSETECLLAGGLSVCQHPNKGQIAPHLMSDPAISKFRAAARAEIEAQQRDEDDDDEEEAA